MPVYKKFGEKVQWFFPPHYLIVVTPPEEIREKLKELYWSKEEFDIALQSDGIIIILETAKIRKWQRKQKKRGNLGFSEY